MRKNKTLSYKDSHKIINNEIYKMCNICEEWFPCKEEYFYNNKLNKSDNLYPYCKKCASLKATEWRKNNRDKWLIIKRKANQKPVEKETVKRLKKRYREEGREREWKRNNKDKIKEYNNKHIQNKTHDITNDEWNMCKEYFNHTCAYCNISEKEAKNLYKQNLHKEHVINDGANDLSNCVSACKSCNSEKFWYSLDEWYNEDNPKFTKERYNKIIKWLDNDYKHFKKKNIDST